MPQVIVGALNAIPAKSCRQGQPFNMLVIPSHPAKAIHIPGQGGSVLAV